MGFHFKEEGDSINYGPNLTDYKFPFPPVDVLPSRDGKNLGNDYCSSPPICSMDALTYARQHGINADTCANIIHNCLSPLVGFCSGIFSCSRQVLAILPVLSRYAIAAMQFSWAGTDQEQTRLENR